MKNFTFTKYVGLGSLMTFSVFSAYAQQNPFDTKRHKDTLLNKGSLHHVKINGANSQPSPVFLQPYSGISKSISYLFTSNSNKRTDNSIEVLVSKETGVPVFISGSGIGSNQRVEAKSDKKAACFDYLEQIKAYTKISNPLNAFEIKSIEYGLNGQAHVRLVQKYNGIKIYGSEAIVHLNVAGSGESFNGNYHLLNKTIDIKPKISQSKALAIVISELSKNTTFRELSSEEKSLLKYKGPIIDTVIYEDKSLIKTYLLAYHISLHPNLLEHWEYFVDAKTGNIIHGFKNSCDIDGPKTSSATDLHGKKQAINTYQIGNNFYFLNASKPMFNLSTSKLPDEPMGGIITLDLNKTFGSNTTFNQITNTTNSWTDPIAVSAHFNAGVAYEYYKNVHDRNSIDAKGGTIISLINAVNNDGSALDNAYWNGEAMFYGNGNTYFNALAGSLDVAGHEMTHGVVQSTANLRYEGESGAINESMADIFGCMMDSSNWFIGEEIIKLSAFPSGALRSLSDPHNGGSTLNDDGYQPRHMSEKFKGADDNGGVHINSGIPNYAFYKLATALKSRTRASKIFYRALSVYLTASSQFSDLRIAVLQSAKDLYGLSSNEYTQTGLAFDAVGISDAAKIVHTVTLPTNPGTEYLLSYNSDSTSTEGMYRSNPFGSDKTLLTGKVIANKPSVTDNGETCVFVGKDKKIYEINVNPAVLPDLKVLNDLPIWGNVAISKDGKRFAAVTFDADTSIYVYDIAMDQLTRFKLYNPTFTGVKSVGPVYADALEWSYNGESILYDCFNRIKNSSGTNIEYWDINTINVWDNSKNTFATGEIFKLFNNLDEGDNLGNPVYSKNSPNIIAFDFVNEVTGNVAVIGLDLELNDIKTIAINNTLGYPSFNKTDTRVAFTIFNTNDFTDINYVTLNPDKISSDNQQAVLLQTKTTNPIYFSVGTRIVVSGLKDENSKLEKISAFPNPTSDLLTLNVTQGFIGSSMEIYNSLGVKLSTMKITCTNFTNDMNGLSEGLYTLVFRGNSNSKYLKIVKQ